MLTPGDLSSRLENDWLVANGGNFPDSVIESADRFAGALAEWFSMAMAAGFPCATAMARRPQLSLSSASALQAGVGATAGQLLATAVAAYMAGQSFGAGASTFPVALSAGVAAITSALTNLELSQSARAGQIAQGCHTLADSTIVIFPAPMPPAPLT